MSTVYFQFPSRHIYTIHFFWFQLLYFLVLKPRKDYPSHSVRFQVGGRLGKSPLLTSWTPPTLLTGPNVLDWSLPVLKLNLINTPTRAIHFSGLIRLCNPSAPNAGQPPAADNRRRGSGHRTNNRNSPTPIVELSTKFQPPKANNCRPLDCATWYFSARAFHLGSARIRRGRLPSLRQNQFLGARPVTRAIHFKLRAQAGSG
jgi:hypothetical protein